MNCNQKPENKSGACTMCMRGNFAGVWSSIPIVDNMLTCDKTQMGGSLRQGRPLATASRSSDWPGLRPCASGCPRHLSPLGSE